MDAKYNHIIDSMKWRIVLNLGLIGTVAGGERGFAAADLMEKS